MSWPGEDQPQGPGGASGGRGRRRRGDAPDDQPVDDPYVTGEYQGGSGRRGTGEFARPAEYVQQPDLYAQPDSSVQSDPYPQSDSYGDTYADGYGESYGDPYGQSRGQSLGQTYGQTYEPPYGAASPGYGQASQEYGQPQQYGQPAPQQYGQPESSPYAPPQPDASLPQYAQPTQYEPTQYAQPSFVRPVSAPQQAQPTYVPSAQPYVPPAYVPQDSQGYGEQDAYVADPYAADPYASDAYAADPYAATATGPANLNSSGFYPIVRPEPVVPQAATQVPTQVPTQAAVQAPIPVQAPTAAGAASTGVGSLSASGTTTSFRVMPGSAEAASERASAVPVTSASSASSATTASVPAPTPSPEGAIGAEDDVSSWLNFVESRADQRQERDRKLRFRLLVLGVVVALIGGGTGVWYFLTRAGRTAATQTTVLFQLKDISGDAVGSVVLVADRGAVSGNASPTGKGAAVLIPSQMAVTGTGLASQPFGGEMGSAASGGGASGNATPADGTSIIAPAGKQAVSDLLGVDVDGVWSVDEITFAAFIDSIGTVILDTNAAVPGTDGKPVVQQGSRQQLSGLQAVVYATYRAPGEGQDKQLERFGQVVRAMLAKIPADTATTEKLLNLQATVPDPALPNDRLAAILAALAGEDQGNRFQVAALPLRQDGSETLDLQAAAPIVKQLLGGAVHAKDNGGLPRVAVYDATGRQDTVSSRTAADAKLQGGGYEPLDSGIQPAADATVVEIPDEGQRSLGSQIAMTLGLGDPNTSVKVVKMDTTLTDAVVVLGRDWSKVATLPADGPTSQSAPAAGAAAFTDAASSAPTLSGPTAVTSSHTSRPTASASRKG